MWYEFWLWTDGEWRRAKAGRMSKQAASGLMSQFAAQYSVRVFRGANIGRMVGAKYRQEDMPALSKIFFPHNLKPMVL